MYSSRNFTIAKHPISYKMGNEIITDAEREHIIRFAQFVKKRGFKIKFFPNGSYEVRKDNEVIREEYNEKNNTS